MSETSKAVFLSYASQDAVAAKKICAALRAAGVEVWFDQNELTGGDAWDAKIRGQVASCALFIPVISAATQARLEGYFRIEWKLAAQRTHAMADEKAFLLPVVIDDTRDAEAKVPAEFKAVQWTRLPGGETPEKFCARVKALLGGEVARIFRPVNPDNTGQETRATPRPRYRVPAAAWLVLALAAGLGVVGYIALRPKPTASQGKRPPTAEKSAAPTTDAKSVAVLPFANLSDDKANEYFSDGISEELLNVLAKVTGLKVTARTSAFFFKDKQVPIAEIAKQLGVAYVVEGSVRKAGDKVRITAQLIKADDGFRVWSETFSRDLKDIFAVQDEIAGLIAKNLEIKMGMASSVVREVNPEAYSLLLQARFFAQRESSEGRKQSIAYYRQAIAKESDYALAWAEMARVYAMLGRFGGMPMREAMLETRAAAQKALILNPDEPYGLNALGWVQRLADWDWRGARKSFLQAVALAPDNPTTLSDAAVLLFNIGQTEEALTLARRGVVRDPLSARAHFSLGEILTNSDRDAEGVEVLSHAIKLAPESEAYQAVLGTVFSRQGRFAEAEASVEREPSEAYRLMARAVVATAHGVPAASSKARDELITQYGVRMAGWIAIVYAAQGDRDQAFVWLERAAQERDRMIPWVKEYFYLRSLYSDARWPEFLHKLGLADDQLK